jgi:hypothetical protein
VRSNAESPSWSSVREGLASVFPPSEPLLMRLCDGGAKGSRTLTPCLQRKAWLSLSVIEAR